MGLAQIVASCLSFLFGAVYVVCFCRLMLLTVPVLLVVPSWHGVHPTEWGEQSVV